MVCDYVSLAMKRIVEAILLDIVDLHLGLGGIDGRCEQTRFGQRTHFCIIEPSQKHYTISALTLT